MLLAEPYLAQTDIFNMLASAYFTYGFFDAWVCASCCNVHFANNLKISTFMVRASVIRPVPVHFTRPLSDRASGL